MTDIESRPAQPESSRVVFLPGALAVFTPCHDAQLLYPTSEAVPGTWLHATCPEEQRPWLLELVADNSQEFGLGAHWRDPADGGTTMTEPENDAPQADAGATAVPLVTQALAVCENAELELPAMLLRDALDVLTDDLSDLL